MTKARVTTAMAERAVEFEYKNWRGEVSTRRVVPRVIWFGETQWHPEPQWFLKALDLDKGEERDFATADAGPWKKHQVE